MARDPAPYHRYRPRLALPSILSLSLSLEFLEKQNKEESANSLGLEFFRFLRFFRREKEKKRF